MKLVKHIACTLDGFGYLVLKYMIYTHFIFWPQVNYPSFGHTIKFNGHVFYRYA